MVFRYVIMTFNSFGLCIEDLMTSLILMAQVLPVDGGLSI